nr:hypothetical protein [Tanacetum cinerariifolium]
MTTPTVTSSTNSQMHNNIMEAVQAIAGTDDSPAIPEHTTVETPMNMYLENKAHFESKKEAIHLILTGIGDEIYSTVDACQTAQECGKLSKGYNKPKWSRFVAIVKQQHKLDEVSYHKLFDILKQYQKEVNELHAERLAKNANPLALVATAQANQDPYYQTSKSHKSYAPSPKPSIPTRTRTSTRYKGKEISKPIKNLALIAKYFKKIYKPTNNNLRTSSNSRNKNVDTTPRYKNDNQSGQFRNQRKMDVVGARKNVGSPVVQQSGIQCFNCKEFGHFAKECRKSKRVKDSAYHKEKMLLCKQAEKGVPLQAEQYDWLEDMDGEIDKKELEVHYSYMAKIQENDQNDVESDDERVALANLIANLKLDTEFEKYKALNDRTVDYDKLERKLNETLGQLAQKDIEIKEGLKTKAYEISVVKEKHDELIKQSRLKKSHYEGLVKQKTKVITDLKLKEEHDIDKMLSMEKQLKFLNEIIYKRSQSIQTIHMMAPKVPTYNGRPTFANPRYLKQAQSEIPCLYVFPYDQSTHANRLILDGEETLDLERESRSKLNKDSVRPYDYTTLNSLYENFKPPTQEYEIQLAHTNEIRKKMQEMHTDLKYVESLEKEIEELKYDKAEFSNMDDMIFELKKLIEKGKGKFVETKFDKPSVVRQLNAQLIPKPLVLGKPDPFSDSLERRYSLKTKSVPKNNVLEGLSKPVTAQTLPQIARQAVSNTNVLKPGMYRIDNMSTQTKAPQSPQTVRNTNPCMSTSIGVNHKTNVSRPQHRSNQLKYKVMPNNSQVKLKKTQVEEYSRISNKIKSVTACNDSLNSRTSNANAVCATCKKCLVDSDHFACATKMLNDVNARTKKPNVVPISTKKPKGHVNKSVATPHKKKVASKSTNQKPKSYYRMIYEKTSKT